MIQCSIQTRGYEMDASASIPPAVLLRYMEHARWTLTGSAGIDLADFSTAVVVATQTLTVCQRIGAYANLTVTAWLSRVGNSSMDISQLITWDDADNEGARVVACGRATLVNVDENHRPAKLKPGVADKVQAAPVDFADNFLPCDKLAVPESAWVLERTVNASELDLLNHVNHSRYVDYIEDARNACGLAGAYGKEIELRGTILAELTKNLTIEYVDEATMGKKIKVLTWAGEQGGTYCFNIVCAGSNDLLARAIIGV